MKLLLGLWLMAMAALPMAAIAPADSPALQPATLTSDQDLYAHVYALETQVSDQETIIAVMWSTLDAPSLATAVATITQSETPRPTLTPSATATRTPQGQPPIPTDEILQASMTASPTWVAGTNTFTPVRTVTPQPTSAFTATITPTPSELPPMVIATNILGSDINIRADCNTSSEIIGKVLKADLPETIQHENQIALDTRYMSSDGVYGWVRLWNWQDGTQGGCIVHERLQPYQMWLNWERWK